jgi:PAS domain S-box-containing protein
LAEFRDALVQDSLVLGLALVLLIGGSRIIVDGLRRRERLQAELRDGEQRLRDVIENMPGIVFQKVRHPDGRVEITFVSGGIYRLHGVRPEEVMADPERLTKLMHPDDLPGYVAVLKLALKTLEPAVAEFRALGRDGNTMWIRNVFQMRQRNDGAIVWEEMASDITREKQADEDRRKLEGQLRRAQKLESLGTLAGGMAHEFNNMLVPVMGMAELAMAELPEDGRPYNNLIEVVENAERAAALVKKIMAFSRNEDAGMAGETCELRAAAESAVGLLRGVLPASITINQDLPAGEVTVGLSAAEVQQIVMNLGNNASHAIEGKVGVIGVALAVVRFDAAHRTRRIMLKRGTYARLSVSDTGCGMDDATLGRIFDPFFTTKEVGKGTGLGLTVTAGLVDKLGRRHRRDERARPGNEVRHLSAGLGRRGSGGGGARIHRHGNGRALGGEEPLHLGPALAAVRLHLVAQVSGQVLPERRLEARPRLDALEPRAEAGPPPLPDARHAEEVDAVDVGRERAVGERVPGPGEPRRGGERRVHVGEKIVEEMHRLGHETHLGGADRRSVVVELEHPLLPAGRRGARAAGGEA